MERVSVILQPNDGDIDFREGLDGNWIMSGVVFCSVIVV